MKSVYILVEDNGISTRPVAAYKRKEIAEKMAESLNAENSDALKMTHYEVIELKVI